VGTSKLERGWPRPSRSKHDTREQLRIEARVGPWCEREQRHRNTLRPIAARPVRRCLANVRTKQEAVVDGADPAAQGRPCALVGATRRCGPACSGESPSRDADEEAGQGDRRQGKKNRACGKPAFERNGRDQIEQAETDQEPRPPCRDRRFRPNLLEQMNDLGIKRVRGVVVRRQFELALHRRRKEQAQDRVLLRVAIDGERALVLHVVALENSLDRPGRGFGMRDYIPDRATRGRQIQDGHQHDCLSARRHG